MSNIFKNYELSFKYPNNWKLLEADDIENCIALRMQLKTFQGKTA